MAQQTKFNMSAATLERLDEWLRKSMMYFSTGNLPRYFNSLKNVSTNAMFKFTVTERKQLRDIEKAYLSETNNGMKWSIVNKYNEVLLDLMNKYGLLLPDKINDLDTAY